MHNPDEERACGACGAWMPSHYEAWRTLCNDCYRKNKGAERDTILRRALEAEHKVELAKKLVLELQSKLRIAQGEARRAAGVNGLGMAPGGGGAGAGLDLATLQRMRRLCHPDKHNNSEASVAVSQLINQLIDKAQGG